MGRSGSTAPTPDLAPVEVADGGLGHLGIGEVYEGVALVLVVLLQWDPIQPFLLYVDHRPDALEEPYQLLLCGVEWDVADSLSLRLTEHFL